MDYELCKKLKEAGFPQKPFWNNYGEVVYYGGSWYFIPVKEGCPKIVFAEGDSYKKGIDRGDNLIKIPTLSELIEACGEPFNELIQGKPKGKTWRATATLLEEDGGVYDYRTSFYDIPEIAVANLWLALNKKSHE